MKVSDSPDSLSWSWSVRSLCPPWYLSLFSCLPSMATVSVSWELGACLFCSLLCLWLLQHGRCSCIFWMNDYVGGWKHQRRNIYSYYIFPLFLSDHFYVCVLSAYNLNGTEKEQSIEKRLGESQSLSFEGLSSFSLWATVTRPGRETGKWEGKTWINLGSPKRLNHI